MSYFVELKNTRTPSFYKDFYEVLNHIKNFKLYSNQNHLDFFYIAVLPIFINSFNTMMKYYVNNTSEQAAMDKDFENIFAHHKDKYLVLELNSVQNQKNFIITFTDYFDNKKLPLIYPKTDNFFHNFFSRQDIDNQINFSINSKIFSFTYNKKSLYRIEGENLSQKNSIHHLMSFFNISSSTFQRIFHLSLYGHTNKLRNLLIGYNYSEFYNKLFIVKDISTYSKKYLDHFTQSISYSIEDKDFLQTECDNLKYYDSELLNQLIISIADLKTSVGIIKDIDSFNVPSLSILEKAFEERFDDISKENIVKLRILRNIAKDRGIVLDYVDERASVNSLTNKKMLIFGDKVNCEVIVIDMQTLISRFSVRKDKSLTLCIKAFFNVLKEDKIFNKILITQGKRGYSHLLTVFCKKDKNHTNDKLEVYSSYFEEAMNLSEKYEHVTESMFYDFLQKAKRTFSLKENLIEKEIHNPKLKNKI